MANERISFYSEHYPQITELLDLKDTIETTYPHEVWDCIHDAFADWLEAGRFAGHDNWQYDDDDPDDYFCFWRSPHHDGKRGPYFIIDFSKAGKHETNKTKIRTSANCSLTFEGNKGPTGTTVKKLVEGSRKNSQKLKAKGFKELEGLPNCYLQIDVGDLLHISAYKEWKKNSVELKRRVEILVRACGPIIENAAKK